MFTGIITNLGIVKEIKKMVAQDLMLTIFIDNVPLKRKLEIGSSISCNGVCLTLVKYSKRDKLFCFQVSNETLSKITDIKINNIINIEFAARFGDEIGGHIVQGHIDSTSYILEKTKIEGSYLYKFHLPKEYFVNIIEKGSIAINGISLTINRIYENAFDVNVIEHSYLNTNLHLLDVEDEVNIEFDIFSKYINKNIVNQVINYGK